MRVTIGKWLTEIYTHITRINLEVDAFPNIEHPTQAQEEHFPMVCTELYHLNCIAEALEDYLINVA